MCRAENFGPKLRRLENWALCLGPVRASPWAQTSLTGDPTLVAMIRAMGHDGPPGIIHHFSNNGQRCNVRPQDHEILGFQGPEVSVCAFEAAPDLRRTRAVAEARAEHARYRAPQGGSSRRRGAKRSAPPEVPVEELTIRESDCLPYEYEGPPMATMGGGGGCVIA